VIFVVDKVGQVFFRVLRLYPLNIIPTTLHIRLHLRVVVIGRTNRRSLGTFQKVKFFLEMAEHEINKEAYFQRDSSKKTFIFTVQNVSCHHLSTRMDYFLLPRDVSNLLCQIISDNQN
jgi:hypothetical protein